MNVFLFSELSRVTRASRTQAARSLFVGAIVAAAALSFPWNAEVQRMAIVFRPLFEIFFDAEMAVAVFILPALVASDFPVERERGTLELLLACPYRPQSIFLGKFGSHAAQGAALLASGLPLAFLAVAFGGVSVERALATCAGIALTAGLGVAVAVRVSLAGMGSVASALAAVLLHVGLIAATAVLGVFIGQFRGLASAVFCLAGIGFIALGAGVFGRSRFRGLEAIAASAALLAGLALFQPLGPRGSRFLDPLALRTLCPWTVYAQGALETMPPRGEYIGALSLHLLGLALVLKGLADPRLGDAVAGSGRGGDPVETRTLAARTGVARPSSTRAREDRASILSRPGREPGLLFKPRLPVRGNPVLWRETIRPPLEARARLVYFVATLAILCAAPAFAPTAGHGTARWGGIHEGLVAELALVALYVAAGCAATIAPECEHGTIGLLLVTGFPTSRILAGKIVAALRQAWPIALVLALHLAVAAVDIGAAASGLVFVAAMTILAVAGLATGASLAAGRLRLALPLAILAPLALWALPFLATSAFPAWAGRLAACDPVNLITGFLEAGKAPFVLSPGAVLAFAVTAGAAAFLPFGWSVLVLERRMRA